MDIQTRISARMAGRMRRVTGAPAMYATRGPDGRWYVEAKDGSWSCECRASLINAYEAKTVACQKWAEERR